MKDKYLYLFIFGWIFIFSACGTDESEKNLIKYKGIDRSLSVLRNSTSENPVNFSILFYGQSIVGELGADILVDSLKKEFPSANISFLNKAIGGFTIPYLLKTANHDVYQENPDLIIFQAYESEDEKLLDTLIKTIRRRSSADIVLFDHHFVWNTNQMNLVSENNRDSIQSAAIREVASKYGCKYIDVRGPWRKYLNDNDLGANILIGNTIDTDVHPNERGKKLLREIILTSLLEKKETQYSTKNDMLREEIALKSWNSSYKEDFIGNWVAFELDTVMDNKTRIEVLIDGDRPSTFPNSYYVSRPSIGYKSWMPALKLVQLGGTFPRKEDWKIIVADIDRVNKGFTYKLEGSITGFDGKGSSESNFISDTGRIKINKEDFYIFQIEKITGYETPDNFEINFSVNLKVEDTIIIKPNNLKYIAFSDSKIGNHTIKLKVLEGETRLNKIIVYRPYLTNDE